MLLQLVEDLRFVIGAFFLIISLILLFAGLLNPESTDPSGLGNLNLIAATLMGSFGTLMLAMALRARKQK